MTDAAVQVTHNEPIFQGFSRGKLALWFFLASEIMFFTGLLGAFVALKTGNPIPFHRDANYLSVPLAATNTAVLITSSLTMALAVAASKAGQTGKAKLNLTITILLACTFLGIKFYEYSSKFLHGYDRPAESGESGEKPGHEAAAEHEPGPSLATCFSSKNWDAWAGNNPNGKYPKSSIFFSCYFTITGFHGLHVIGGIVPLLFLLIQACRGKLLGAVTEYVGLYWHFVDLVWIFLFPLFYLLK